MEKYKRVQIGTENDYDVYNNGVLSATIQRTKTSDGYDVTVTLPCGHRDRYWKSDLSDKEYIERTEYLKHNT